MASDRVECPECQARFLVPEDQLDGVIVCRDCRAEFQLEPLDEPELAPKKPRAKSKVASTDDEPDEWKTDLPVRSPIPILIALVIVQGVIGLVLIGYGLMGGPSMSGTTVSTAPNSAYYNSGTKSTSTMKVK